MKLRYPEDFIRIPRAEIERLEKAKSDLRNQLTKEVKQNAILQSNLERRKKALRECRLALEQDVARLQDQLQKENELRTVLEAGLYMAQGSLPISSNIYEKTKAELAEIAQGEVDVMTLKQKADMLQSQVNKQCQKNAELSSRSQAQQTVNNPADSKCKDEGGNAANVRSTDRSTTKDTAQNSEHVRAVASEPMSIATASKMLVARAEGANATSSALAKLTNRLNFLKERREKLDNEAQAQAQAQASSGSAGSERVKRSEPQQPGQNSDGQSVPKSDKTSGSGRSAPNQRETSSNTDEGRKSDIVPPKTSSR